MTESKAIQCVAGIQALYSYYGKDGDLDTLVNLWVGLMKDYTDEEVSYGLAKAMQEVSHAPSPADVISRIEAVRNLGNPTPEDLWVEYTKLIRKAERYSYDAKCTALHESGKTFHELAMGKLKELFDNTSPEIQKYLSSVGELIRKATTIKDDEWPFEENRFKRTVEGTIKTVRLQMKTDKRIAEQKQGRIGDNNATL